MKRSSQKKNQEITNKNNTNVLQEMKNKQKKKKYRKTYQLE